MPVFRCKNIYTWGPSVLRPGLCLRPALGRNNFMASLDDSSIWGCRICAISTSGFKPTRQGLSAFTARKSGKLGCEGIIKKFAKTRHLRGIIKKLAIWRGDSSSGWPQPSKSHCDQTPNTFKPQNRERFFRKPLNFFPTNSQSIKFSRYPIRFPLLWNEVTKVLSEVTLTLSLL